MTSLKALRCLGLLTVIMGISFLFISFEKGILLIILAFVEGIMADVLEIRSKI